MTAGSDGLTLDGMSMERIENIIARLKDHSYQPNPARRVYIAKKNSKKKAHIDKKNINRINNNLKYGFQIIKGLGRNHNKRKYSRFS